MAGNVETIKRGFDAFNSGDVQTVMETWTDDVRWEGSNAEGRAKSGTEVKVPFVHVWRMQNGKGREGLALTDTLEVARALGVS